MNYKTRLAVDDDMAVVAEIYNEGIKDKVSTLETRIRTPEDMLAWFQEREDRYKVIVCEDAHGQIVGWASLNVYKARESYAGVADLSIYVKKSERCKGIGTIILNDLVAVAKDNDFFKLVLSVFRVNEAAINLYKSQGFREVGTFMSHGRINNKWIDVVIMEMMIN